MSCRRSHFILFSVLASVCLLVALELSGQTKLKKQPLTIPAKAMPAAAAQTNCANALALPDIFLEKVFVEGYPTAQGARPNQNYQIAALVENRGQCETGPFIMRICASIQDLTAGSTEIKVLCNQLVQSIQPTRERTPSFIRVSVNFHTPPTIYSGYYKFFGIADPDNKVNEFNESNNSTKDLRVEGDAIIEVVRDY